MNFVLLRRYQVARHAGQQLEEAAQNEVSLPLAIVVPSELTVDSYRASPRSIRPVYTGGPVLLTKDGQWLITTLGEEVLITQVRNGVQVARVKGVSRIASTHLRVAKAHRIGLDPNHRTHLVIPHRTPYAHHLPSVNIHPLLSTDCTSREQSVGPSVSDILAPSHQSTFGSYSCGSHRA